MRAPAGQKFREIPADLVDQPPRPVRETMDETLLSDLAESIREQGVLEPLLVCERDGRYEILAGHRRYIAARMAGLVTLPCVIRAGDTASEERAKIHENIGREDLNAGEEAVYYSRLLESECGGDVDHLVDLVRRKRAYIEERLILLRGDPDVLEALRQRRISLAVARELNRIPDRGFRLNYLDAAIRGGASARLVAEWRAESARLIAALPAEDGAPAPPETIAPATAEASGIVCAVCDDREAPYNLDLVYVHRGVCRKILDRYLAGLAGEKDAP